MSDDDLIRRGDALAVFEGPDDCPVQFEYGEGRYRINAIPAVTAPQGAWPEAASRMKAALDAYPDYKMFGISADDLRSILAALALAKGAADDRA